MPPPPGTSPFRALTPACPLLFALPARVGPGLLLVDRVLYSSVVYPHNYGFIPRTYCECV